MWPYCGNQLHLFGRNRLRLHNSTSNSSSAILKETARSPEMSEHNYQSTRRNNPEYCNINRHRCDNATSHTPVNNSIILRRFSADMNTDTASVSWRRVANLPDKYTASKYEVVISSPTLNLSGYSSANNLTASLLQQIQP